MRVVRGIDGLAAEHGRIFAVLGVFDGLHVGHLYMLRELGWAATARDAQPAVITFDHHPDEILAGSAPPLLCDPAERLERLAAAGVELTVVAHFDVRTRMTPYDAYVRHIASRVDLAGFLMTADSAFGFERRGTPEAVAELGRALGYEVVVVPTLELDGRPIRSAEIRADIAAGDLAGATRLLGRPYAVVGRASAGEDSATVAFDMPVALPPAGTYPVLISEAAVPVGSAGEGSPDGHRPDERAGNLTIGPDGVRLEPRPRLEGPLRLTFA
jgi:riboflavin kinase/FMN adenylyltransferase